MDVEQKKLEHKIGSVLDTVLERREDFHEKIKALIEEYQDEALIYKAVIYRLSSLDMSKDESVRHWKNIIAVQDEMSRKLGRQVAFRVAMLDYFLQEIQDFRKTMVVELYVFESSKYNMMVDDLTGIYNHRFLREYLWKETKRSIRYNKIFSLLIVDIDNFRDVNEHYGALAGDEILKNISHTLEKNMRIEDVAARFMADEFYIILPETDKTGALSFASRVKRLIEATETDYGTIAITVKVSIGVSTFKVDSEDPVEMAEFADKALYRAKYMGKNRIVAFSKSDFD